MEFNYGMSGMIQSFLLAMKEHIIFRLSLMEAILGQSIIYSRKQNDEREKMYTFVSLIVFFSGFARHASLPRRRPIVGGAEP